MFSDGARCSLDVATGSKQTQLKEKKKKKMLAQSYITWLFQSPSHYLNNNNKKISPTAI